MVSAAPLKLARRAQGQRALRESSGGRPAPKAASPGAIGANLLKQRSLTLSPLMKQGLSSEAFLGFLLHATAVGRGRVSARQPRRISLLAQRNAPQRNAPLLSASLRFASGNLWCSTAGCVVELATRQRRCARTTTTNQFTKPVLRKASPCPVRRRRSHKGDDSQVLRRRQHSPAHCRSKSLG